MKLKILTVQEGIALRFGYKMASIWSCLKKYHVDSSLLVELDGEDSPDKLHYATIVQAQKKYDSSGMYSPIPINLVKSVYEWQGYPFMYLIDGNEPLSDAQLLGLRNFLAMRGDAPYMGLVTKDNLEVFHITLGNLEISKSRIDPKAYGDNKESFLSQLRHPRCKQKVSGNWSADVIYKLIQKTRANLMGTGDFGEKDAISIVVRELLLRILADKQLLPRDFFKHGGTTESEDNLHSDSSIHNCFSKLASEILFPRSTKPRYQKSSDVETITRIKLSTILVDSVFNGDILPLSKDACSVFSLETLHELGNIGQKANDDELFFDWKFDWNYLDFALVPVEVLGIVFESLLKGIKPSKLLESYHTSSSLINTLVKVSLSGKKSQGKVKEIKILDPLAGAGTFLIAAYRELVAEYWHADKIRPDTGTLKTILERQITGFEMDELAMGFSALGLHLMSIELNPDPVFDANFKFTRLIGSVLHQMNRKEFVSEFFNEHSKKYSVVIGNPLARNCFDNSDWAPIAELVNKLARIRNLENPDIVLRKSSIDLAYVWFSTYWAEENGQITLILKSRWLFHQSKRHRMPEARMAILRTLSVTSIVNCSSISKSRYSSKPVTPFCILIARNRPSHQDFPFKFINSTETVSQKNTKTVQISTQKAKMLSVKSVELHPEVMKLYSVGSNEDFAINEQIRSKIRDSKDSNGEISGEKKFKRLGDISGTFASGVGYEPRSRKELALVGDKNKQPSIIHSNEFEIKKSNLGKILISPSELSEFSSELVKSSGKKKIYNGPMVVLDSTPSKFFQRINASVCDFDAKFNKNIYGYSFSDHDEGGALSRFLCLILRSKIALWQVFIQSGKFDNECDFFEKFELDRICVPVFETLSDKEKVVVEDLFNESVRELNLEAIDRWAIELFGMGESELQIMLDTLKSNLRQREKGKTDGDSPTSVEVDSFCRSLFEKLKPLAEYKNLELSVECVKNCSKYPWECIDINFRNGSAITPPNTDDFSDFWLTANKTLSSTFINPYNDSGLLVGKIAHRRFWNSTHVDLLANEVAWSGIGIIDERQ